MQLPTLQTFRHHDNSFLPLPALPFQCSPGMGTGMTTLVRSPKRLFVVALIFIVSVRPGDFTSIQTDKLQWFIIRFNIARRLRGRWPLLKSSRTHDCSAILRRYISCPWAPRRFKRLWNLVGKQLWTFLTSVLLLLDDWWWRSKSNVQFRLIRRSWEKGILAKRVFECVDDQWTKRPVPWVGLR